jgi:hypothetical protein
MFFRRQQRPPVSPAARAPDVTSDTPDEAAQQQRDELEERRRSAQRVTLAWHSWLAADQRDRDAHYRAFVWALADEEQAAARVKRMIQPTDTGGCATPTGTEPTK